MKRTLFLLATLLLCANAASADVTFMAALPGKFDISYTLPSGEKKTGQIFSDYQGGPGQGSTTNVPDAVVNLKVDIVDDLGAAVWSGTLKNYACVLLYKGADGKVTAAQVGWYIQADQKMPQAAKFLNITGGPVTFSLLGAGGAKGLPGVTLPAGPDFKEVTRLPEGEFTYYVQGNDGSKAETTVSPGWYYLIYKTNDGKIGAKQCGTMMTPSSRK